MPSHQLLLLQLQEANSRLQSILAGMLAGAYAGGAHHNITAGEPTPRVFDQQHDVPSVAVSCWGAGGGSSLTCKREQQLLLPTHSLSRVDNNVTHHQTATLFVVFHVDSLL